MDRNKTSYGKYWFVLRSGKIKSFFSKIFPKKVCKKNPLKQITYLSVCVNVTPFTTSDALDITNLKKWISFMYVNATGQNWQISFLVKRKYLSHDHSSVIPMTSFSDEAITSNASKLWFDVLFKCSTTIQFVAQKALFVEQSRQQSCHWVAG